MQRWMSILTWRIWRWHFGLIRVERRTVNISCFFSFHSRENCHDLRGRDEGFGGVESGDRGLGGQLK